MQKPLTLRYRDYVSRKSDIDRELIEEQIEYYDRRAPEYDETSEAPHDPLAPEFAQVVTALNRFQPRGKVLELACGTAKRTQWLLRHAESITSLDASPAMLELARQRITDKRVRFILADAFGWEPDDKYDVVFFAFWLSHVPPARFRDFWDLVGRCLTAKGRVFFVDEGVHEHWQEESVNSSTPLVRRRLLDGTEHDIVKMLWEPQELETKLTQLGWRVTVHSTGALYWGEGHGAS
jgi:SAM-dependent methyltransferase